MSRRTLLSHDYLGQALNNHSVTYFCWLFYLLSPYFADNNHNNNYQPYHHHRAVQKTSVGTDIERRIGKHIEHVSQKKLMLTHPINTYGLIYTKPCHCWYFFLNSILLNPFRFLKIHAYLSLNVIRLAQQDTVLVLPTIETLYMNSSLTFFNYFQALDGFMLTVAHNGHFIYVSDTIEHYLGLRQVRILF